MAALTDEQLQELKTLLSTGAAKNLTATLPDGDQQITHTAAEWLAIQDTNALRQIIEKPADIGLPNIPNDVATKAEIMAAIVTGEEYDAETGRGLLQEVAALIDQKLIFATEPAKIVALDKILLGYDSCKANFDALKTRAPVSINDYFGGNIDQADLNALVTLTAE